MCVDHGWSVRCMTSKATLEYPQFNNYYLAHKTQQVIPKPQIRIFTNFLIDLTISVYLFVIAFLSNTICLAKIGSWISWAIYDWYEKKYQFHLSGKCVLHTSFLREVLGSSAHPLPDGELNNSTIAVTLLQRLLAMAVTMRPLEGNLLPAMY